MTPFQWLLPETAQDSIIDVFGSTLSMQSLSDASYFTLRGAPRLFASADSMTSGKAGGMDCEPLKAVWKNQYFAQTAGH